MKKHYATFPSSETNGWLRVIPLSITRGSVKMSMLVLKHASWLVAQISSRVVWSNKQVALKCSFVTVFIETTGFCDVVITYYKHTKLAICLLLFTYQSSEWNERHIWLLQVLMKHIENILIPFWIVLWNFVWLLNRKVIVDRHALRLSGLENLFDAIIVTS